MCEELLKYKKYFFYPTGGSEYEINEYIQLRFPNLVKLGEK